VEARACDFFIMAFTGALLPTAIGTAFSVSAAAVHSPS
jgi:hypothetical protein